MAAVTRGAPAAGPQPACSELDGEMRLSSIARSHRVSRARDDREPPKGDSQRAPVHGIDWHERFGDYEHEVCRPAIRTGRQEGGHDELVAVAGAHQRYRLRIDPQRQIGLPLKVDKAQHPQLKLRTAGTVDIYVERELCMRPGPAVC